MTDPKHTEPRVEVTQADREAVQAFHRAMAEKLFADIASGEPPSFGDDAGHDGDTIHQAFARHRTAAEAASREEVERLRAQLTLAANRLDVCVVDAIADGEHRRSINYKDWAEETRRAALSPTATEGEG